MRTLLDTYLRRLLEVNQTMNLTSVRDYDEAWVRHIEDSLALLKIADFRDKCVLDVGSGAGLPGIPLKIAEPGIHLTLLDATGKKVRFLRETTDILGLSHVECVHARAEEYAHTAARESFDIVTARGVTAMDALCEICLPFVRVGGLMIAMKSGDAEPSRETLWGGEKRGGVWYELPGGLRHYAALFIKIAPTPVQYPREWKAIMAGR